MSDITNRVERLERRSIGPSRTIIVWTGHGHTDDDVHQAIKAKGIQQTSSDIVVNFCTVYEDRDGNPIPADYAPRVTL